MRMTKALRLLLTVCFFIACAYARKSIGTHRRQMQSAVTAVAAPPFPVEPKLLTNEDFENHPAMNTSLGDFNEIMKKMHKLGRGSFHSYVHVIAVAIRLLNASTVFEIGSYCGATIALGLSVPSVRHFVAVDMRPNDRPPNTHDIIKKNIELFNVHNTTVDFIGGNSRDEWVRKAAFDVLPKHSVDVMFIDGDHFYPVPDFEYYQHLLRPGGLLIWDDFGGHPQVIFHVTLIAQKNIKCFHVIGCPKNVAQATMLEDGNFPARTSNEFIMQKRWNCTNWFPL